METNTAAATNLPRYSDMQGRDAAAIAEIRFGAGYVSVHKRAAVIDGVLCKFRGSEMFDYIEGETALECAQRVARRVVANMGGERAVARTLRRVRGGCELPNPAYTRFGWTRETRGVGAVSVIPDVYLVF